jgi:hypothetical protein
MDEVDYVDGVDGVDHVDGVSADTTALLVLRHIRQFATRL